jgi:hypothetical protein
MSIQDQIITLQHWVVGAELLYNMVSGSTEDQIITLQNCYISLGEPDLRATIFWLYKMQAFLQGASKLLCLF